jgi:hypothetical protein
LRFRSNFGGTTEIMKVERAKIWHTRAELLLRDGDASRAQELATSALETFTLSRTRYDITHARVTLSRAALASGHERLAVQQGALARSAVQVMGYGLLCVMYPDDVFDLAGRIYGALTAYACGDALGVPRWQLPARISLCEAWLRGPTRFRRNAGRDSRRTCGRCGLGVHPLALRPSLRSDLASALGLGFAAAGRIAAQLDLPRGRARSMAASMASSYFDLKKA